MYPSAQNAPTPALKISLADLQPDLFRTRRGSAALPRALMGHSP